MTNEELNVKILPFLQNGFIHDRPNSVSGNGWVYTAELVVGIIKNKYPTTIFQTFWNAFYCHQVVPGLLKRTPNNAFGQESIDDYVGAGVLSYFVDNGGLARDIIKYGQNQKAKDFDKTAPEEEELLFDALKLKEKNGITYVYNNINPGKFNVRACLGRFPHLIAFLKYCGGSKPSLFQKLCLAGNFLKKTKEEDCDRTIMPWLMSSVLHKKSWILSFCMWIWRRRAKKAYGTPGVLLMKYFSVHEEHPLVQLLLNVSF